jgi:twinfilin-like protein
MLYSAGVQPLAHKVKQLGLKIDRKSETSEPEEINEAWLLQELRQLDSGLSTPASTERIAFAKPKGPPRRR